MTKEFKIDLHHQIKSFRESFIALAFTLGAVVLGPIIIKGMDFGTMLVICSLFWIVTSVAPTLLFHINYLIANWRTKLIVDDYSETIQIIQSGRAYNYKFSEIKVIKHVLGHYRPGRYGGTKSWIPIPFDNYGYLEIITNDKKLFYLTSLMLDPFKPPLSVDRTEYGFPIIKGI